jgi:hypothetical protein
MTNIEEEVVFLKAIKELIDSMVNFEMLAILGSDPDSQIQFRTATHQKFFDIILVDFLSKTNKNIVSGETDYLDSLQSICESPHFEVAGSVTALRESTTAFVAWLEQEVEVPTWFPAINKNTVLKITRKLIVEVCGNISKHNFLRLDRMGKKLKTILESSKVPITLDDALLALADFYEQFHTNILSYHSSTIAEFLNNMRWGIYEYLQPEFQRSIVWETHDPPKYRYTYPTSVTTKFAKECYWELMNEVRNPPYVRRFQVTPWLKLRY